MQKIIKRYGNSLIVIINPEEQQIYDLKEKDIIDITITKIIKFKEEDGL
jgi:hypothetical protein